MQHLNKVKTIASNDIRTSKSKIQKHAKSIWRRVWAPQIDQVGWFMQTDMTKSIEKDAYHPKVQLPYWNNQRSKLNIISPTQRKTTEHQVFKAWDTNERNLVKNITTGKQRPHRTTLSKIIDDQNAGALWDCKWYMNEKLTMHQVIIPI